MRELWKRWIIAVCVSVGILGSSISVSYADTYFCGFSSSPCSSTPIQGNFLFNSQTTGAATTAVVVTIAAGGAGTRTHIYSVEGRCNTAANTSSITITDGGTTIWSTAAAEVLAATNYVRVWSTGLTGATNSAVVITLAACAAGTGTLIVQADRY